MKHWAQGLVAAMVLAVMQSAAAAPITLQVNVDGTVREALVYAARPSDTPGAKDAVIFAFHGHGGSAQSFDQTAQLEKFWPEAIVVYMQGLPTTGFIVDTQGRTPGWQIAPGQSGDRDLKFFDAALAKLHQQYPIDDKRIYVAGHSNGAFFAYLLWAERGDKIAAIASSAGRLVRLAHLSVPRSLITISGRTDQLVPLEDQMGSVEAAKKLDGATGPGESCGDGCTRFGGANGLAVETLVHDGGHIYSPDASPRIVDFFKTHALP